MNVLLVDDSASDVRLTEEAMKQGSVPVNLMVAHDGAEAIEFLHQRDGYAEAIRPDLILLDLNLPKVHGREVLAHIKNDPDLKRIPVLVLTTSRLAQDVDKAYNLNANCYIAKPMHLDEFFAVMRSIQNFWFTTAKIPAA